MIDVMHYPNDNCKQGTPEAVVPQNVFQNYLSHTQVQNIVKPYAAAAIRSNAAGKKFMMMETNTASCGVSTSIQTFDRGISDLVL